MRSKQRLATLEAAALVGIDPSVLTWAVGTVDITVSFPNPAPPLGFAVAVALAPLRSIGCTLNSAAVISPAGLGNLLQVTFDLVAPLDEDFRVETTSLDLDIVQDPSPVQVQPPVVVDSLASTMSMIVPLNGGGGVPAPGSPDVHCHAHMTLRRIAQR